LVLLKATNTENSDVANRYI